MTNDEAMDIIYNLVNQELKYKNHKCYWKLDTDLYSFVPNSMFVYMFKHNNKTVYITKGQLINAVTTCLDYYMIPYSDYNATKLAKYALDHCDGDNIITFLNPHTDDRNIDAVLLDEIPDFYDGTDDEDPVYDEDYDAKKIANYLHLNFGYLRTHKLVRWIDSVIDESLDAHHYLKEMACLHEISKNLHNSTTFEQELWSADMYALPAKLNQDEDLTQYNKILLQSAQMTIQRYPNSNQWSTNNTVDYFINYLDKAL